MTKRQANAIIAGILAIIVTQLLFGFLLLRGQERTRKEAEAAQVSAGDTLEMQKVTVGRPSLTMPLP